MRSSKTLRTAPPTFSADGISFSAPKSWAEMTQDQIYYTLFLLATFSDHTVVKTYMFFRFCGISVLKKDRYGWICETEGHKFTISVAQVESLIGQFSYIDSYETFNVRLEDVDGHKAADVLLHGVRFVDFLNMEKYYQLFQMKEQDRYLQKLGDLLYCNKIVTELKYDKAELLGVYLWFSHVKLEMSRYFPDFFKSSGGGSEDGAAPQFDILKSINVQIRALTDGDVTKEEQIYNIDCWRALTELNFKAKESDEFNKKYNKPTS